MGNTVLWMHRKWLKQKESPLSSSHGFVVEADRVSVYVHAGRGLRRKTQPHTARMSSGYVSIILHIICNRSDDVVLQICSASRTFSASTQRLTLLSLILDS